METPRSPLILLAEYIRRYGPVPSVRLTVASNIRGGEESYTVTYGHVRLVDGRVVNEWDDDVEYESYRQATAAYHAALEAGAVSFLLQCELTQEDGVDVLCRAAPDSDLAAEAVAWREIAHVLWRLSWGDGVGPWKGGGDDK